MAHFTIENEDNIRVITLNRTDKEMNVLSEDLLKEFDGIIADLNSGGAKGAVFLSGKEDNFIAGADINEIAKLKTPELATAGSKSMQAVFQRLAEVKIPTVAAINGSCMGGGTEFALACTWRIATDDPATAMALPEIQLGIIPGAGGTQRLPRLIGIQTALDMILTGKRIKGPKALKMGLVDACVPKQLLRSEAIKLAKKPRSSQPHGAPTKGLSQNLTKMALEGNPVGRRIMHKKAKEMIDKKTKGFYPASYKALDAVFDGFEMSIKNGLDLEARLFGQLVSTHESQSLIHLFHSITGIKKHPYKQAGKERFGDDETKLVGLVGGGFMGAGITTVLLDKGIRVRMSDPSKEANGRLLKHVRDYFAKKVERKRMKSFELQQKVDMVSPSTTPIGLNRCDIVIEAVFEDLKLKQNILKQLEEGAHKDWIFASNTSAIPISDIAKASKNPERVLGMHFFSPVEKMPLLEIIVTPQTAPWATARAIEVGKIMGKQVIVVKDSPGFYTTRALAFYLCEAALLLTEGVPMEVIDKALMDFGYPVGPITLIDEVGIDVGIHVLKTIEKAYPDRMQSPPALKDVESSGRLGRKNSKGFYLYAEGKKGGPDPEIYKFLKGTTAKGGAKKDLIVDRCNLIFVNESVRCLEEGILPSGYEGDVGAVFGLGFPPFWGGPFKYIDLVGAKEIVERLERLASEFGPRFKPAKMLAEKAAKNEKFYPEE